MAKRHRILQWFLSSPVEELICCCLVCLWKAELIFRAKKCPTCMGTLGGSGEAIQSLGRRSRYWISRSWILSITCNVLSTEANHFIFPSIGINSGTRGITILPGEASDGPSISSTKEFYHLKCMKLEHYYGLPMFRILKSSRRSFLPPKWCWHQTMTPAYSTIIPGSALRRYFHYRRRLQDHRTDRTGLYSCHSMVRGYKTNVSIMEVDWDHYLREF